MKQVIDFLQYAIILVYLLFQSTIFIFKGFHKKFKQEQESLEPKMPEREPELEPKEPDQESEQELEPMITVPKSELFEEINKKVKKETIDSIKYTNLKFAEDTIQISHQATKKDLSPTEKNISIRAPEKVKLQSPTVDSDQIERKIVTKITEVFTKDNIQTSKKENSFKGNDSENKAPPNEFTSTIKMETRFSKKT